MAATRVSVDPDLLTGDDLRIDGADPIALAPIVCVIAFSVLAVVIFSAMGGVTESGALSMARTRQVRRVVPVTPVIPVPTYSDEYLPPAPVPVWRGSFSEPPSSH
ncbi:hypothetical protein [Candidatus Frankia nodulisporulans]|uniref:hypothetical protein n=1 Tax=Candidatus Frankia nodulisporulans TaxID=2060052 RepID=UPI001CDBA72A|nr:hypothetical protein [Candidatus Frankia nodulisporulans]